MGANGGVGTTTISLNVAAVLVQLQKSVIVIELHPSFGTLSVLLNCSPVENLMNLIGLAPDQIDERELKARLLSQGKGLRVLFGPQKATEFQELHADSAAAIVRQASAVADFVVIDLPAVPGAASRVACSLADMVALVLEPQRTCLTTARKTISICWVHGASAQV
jgi:pilus assembly protein CpaE